METNVVIVNVKKKKCKYRNTSKRNAFQGKMGEELTFFWTVWIKKNILLMLWSFDGEQSKHVCKHQNKQNKKKRKKCCAWLLVPHPPADLLFEIIPQPILVLADREGKWWSGVEMLAGSWRHFRIRRLRDAHNSSHPDGRWGLLLPSNWPPMIIYARVGASAFDSPHASATFEQHTTECTFNFIQSGSFRSFHIFEALEMKNKKNVNINH